MFLLLREVGQSVLIGEGVRVEVLAISRKKVKLGVEARGKEAIRYEVWIKRKGENDGSAKK